jgi:hypothetical protein
MLINIIKKIRDRIRYRLVLSYIFERLATIGVDIKPFYFCIKFLPEKIDPNLEPKLEPLAANFLSSSEINRIYEHPENKQLMRDNKRLLEEGYRCFGLKYNDEVVSYLWCNLRRCHEVNPFRLGEDEAYLSGVFTFKAYRGKYLAPFLRYQLYQHLTRMGKTKVYTLINIFNTPAIKLNKKLNSKPQKIIININLFNKYTWNFMTRFPNRFLITI